jgi:very-short-patch-repair endonuclease
MARIAYKKLDFAKKLRKDETDTEKKLWRLLRSRQLAGYKFRRQRVIGTYIVDLCCLKPKLVIELDGGQHQEGQHYDEERTLYLMKQGFQVIRFWDNEVLQHPNDVTASIYRALTLRPLPPSVGEGMKNG